MRDASNDPRDPSDLHRFLGNQRRLIIIGYLSLFESGAEIEVRHVARVIKGVENEVSPDQVSTGDYESAYNALIQTHLPKFAAVDLLEYDDRSKVIVVDRQLQQYALIVALSQFITTMSN